MLLAIDIGNTNITIGVYTDSEWVNQWRIQTLADRTNDEYSVLIEDLFNQAGQRFDTLEQVIISSVVPSLTPAFEDIIQEKTGFAPLILDGTLDTGITYNSRDPKSIGADLIADAVAAYHHFRETCLVVDFGTATTIMVVKEPGVLMGGAIGSGLRVTADSLVKRAAQLPQIPLKPPEQVIGRNTVESMQSGLVLGHLCMVEGLIERMRKELGTPAKVIATGGFSTILASYTDHFDAVDPLLTLNGMRIIAEREKK